MSFAADLKKASVAIINESNEIRQAITIELFNSVILDTPVGNPDLWLHKDSDGTYVDYIFARGEPDYVGGRARGNWQITLGTPAVGEIDRVDPEGTETTDEVEEVVAASNPDGVMYLTNNLPYIERLENGWSSQAPAGMVRKNIARIDQILKEKVST